VVLDANGAKNYTATLLSSPYRLVIEVQAQPQPVQNAKAMPAVVAPPAKTALPPIETPKVSENVSETMAVSAAVPAPEASEPIEKPAVKTAARTVAAKPSADTTTAVLQPPTSPKATRDGQQSLTRELGLKISRIVIDAGHGGKDTGTIGPHGLMEKDLCLDVALRLGKQIEQKLPGAEVIYTRKDDTFIPL
jgi:N-acetylmuramoyl-L-alanine amidase